MDSDENLEELATELYGKGKAWGLLHIAAGTALMGYFAWAGALMFGLHKVPVQVPYVHSSAKQIKNIMLLLKGRSGKLVDLGSGDGRIVLEAYKQGFRPAIGYELNPWLVRLSNLRAWRAGCSGKVLYLQEDLWKSSIPVSSGNSRELYGGLDTKKLADPSDCINTTVFLAPSVVPSLERKLLAELPDEACVVTARFPFFKWAPSSVAGNGLERAWAYNIKTVRIPCKAAGGLSAIEVICHHSNSSLVDT